MGEVRLAKAGCQPRTIFPLHAHTGVTAYGHLSRNRIPIKTNPESCKKDRKVITNVVDVLLGV